MEYNNYMASPQFDLNLNVLSGLLASLVGIVLLLGPVLQDASEFDIIEHSRFDGGLAVHFVHLKNQKKNTFMISAKAAL